MLEILFQGFLEWVYTLVLAIWEYFSGAIIDIMSMDFAYLESHIPVLPVIQQSMLAVGWALLIGNLIFQSARSMLTGLGFEAEDPKLLFTRTFVFSFLLLASPQICEIGLNLTARVIALVELPSAVLITTLSERVFAGFATAWLLVIVCGLVVMYQSIKLFIEMAERYFILSMLTITSPLAFGMGGSKSTSGIFTGWCKMYGSMCLLMVLNVVFVKILMSVLSYSPVGVDVLPWMVLVMAVVRTAKKSDSIITRIGLNPAITNEPRFPGMLSFIVARTMMSVVGNTIKQNGAAGSHAGARSGSGGSSGYQSGTGGAGRNGNGGAGRNGPQQNHGGAPSPSGGASSGTGGSSPNSSEPHVDAAETTRNTSGSGQRSGGRRKSGARRGDGNRGRSTRHHYENNGGVQNQAAHQDSSNTARQDVSNQTSNAQYTTQNTGTASGGQFHQTGIPTGQDGQGTRRTSVPPGTHRAPAYTRPASVGTPGTAPAGTAGETAGDAASGTVSVSETRETRYTSRPQNAAVSRTSVGVPTTLSASRSETAHGESSESSSNSSRFSSAVQSTSANPTAPASVSPVDVTVDKGSQASVKDSRFTHRTESYPADMAKGGGTVVTASPASNTVPHSTTGPSPIVTPSEKPAASESGETRITNRPAPVDRNPSGTGTHIPAAPSRTEAFHSSVTAEAERHSGAARFTSVASQSGTVFQETVTDSGKPMERNSMTFAPRPAAAPAGTAVSPVGAVGKDTGTGSMETRFSQRDSSKTVEHSRNTVTTSTPRPETSRDSTTGRGTESETRLSTKSAATGNSPERVPVIPPAGPRQSVPDRPGHSEPTEHPVTHPIPALGKGASAPKQSGAAGNVSFADTRQTMRETARQTGGTGPVVTRQERTAAPSVLHDSSPQATVPAAKGSADMARSEKPAHPERPGRPNAIPDRGGGVGTHPNSDDIGSRHGSHCARTSRPP